MANCVLIFRLPGEESARNAASLARTVRASGREPRVIAYWPDASVDLAMGETTLLPGDISSAPRLSEFELRRGYGLSLDLPDLQVHNFATGQSSLEHLLPETAWSQHLRGIAAVTVDLIMALAPSHVFVAHGAEVVSRIIAEAAAHCGVPKLYWESGFFPGTLYLDPFSPHFYHGDTRLDRASGTDFAYSPAARAETVAFIDAWKSRQDSKYHQDENEWPRSQLREWAAQDERPILFLPGQMEHDANVLPHLGDAPSFAALVRSILDAVPDRFRIVYKPHPRAPQNDCADLTHEPSDRLFIARGVSIHTIFSLSAAVVVCTSNVGLEAALFGLPVLALGRPIYASQGVTHDLEHIDELGAWLASDRRLGRPSEEDVVVFVARLMQMALLKDGDADGLEAALKQATPGPNTRRGSWYPPHVRECVEVARELDHALRRERRMAEALATLPATAASWLFRRHDREAVLAHPFGSERVSALQMACSPQAVIKCDAPESEPPITMSLPPLDCAPDPAGVLTEACKAAVPGQALAFPFCLERRRPGAIQSFTVKALLDLAHFRIEGWSLSALYLRGGQAAHGVILAIPSPNAQTHPLPFSSLQASYAPIRVPPRFFMSRGDALKGDEPASLVLITGRDTVVYGPYIMLPSGRWRVDMGLREKPRPAHRSFLPHRRPKALKVHLEIVANEAVVGRRELELDPSGRVSQEFNVPDQHARYEFRVISMSETAGRELMFDGVNLEWLGLD